MERFTIQLPDDLVPIAKECIRRERYRSMSELFASFIRHWAVSQQAHAMTGEWAALDGQERDKLDAGLRALVDSGKGEKGSWIKAQIYDAIKELNGPDAKTPTVEQVLRRVPKVARAKLVKG
jgi:Arc/MetJ-type ribon-helix-helix transcriptional regulator